MTCLDALRALPDFFHWIFAWAVFAPVLAVVLTAIYYELRHAKALHMTRHYERKIFK